MSLRRKGKMIAETANNIDLGDRVSWCLRSAGLTAKEVGRILGASEGTGKRLRAGVPPTTEQLTKFSRRFGWPFVSFVFEAVIGPDDAALAAELEDINRCLERLESNDGMDRTAHAAIPPVAGPTASAAGRVVVVPPVGEVRR